jgi:hypothetical protein
MGPASLSKSLVWVWLFSLSFALATPNATSTKLYLLNGTDSVGFGYPVRAVSFDVNTTTGVLTNRVTLPNVFGDTYQPTSGAAVCGRFYVVIVTDVPISAGLAIADTSSNATILVQTDPWLFHSVSCDPSSEDLLVGVVNNPWGDYNQYSVVQYNWRTKKVVTQSSNFSYNLQADPVNDAFFSVFPGQSAFVLEDGTAKFNPLNSGVLNLLDLSAPSSQWKSYTVKSLNPLQIARADATSGQLRGLTYTVNSADEVTSLNWGVFRLNGGAADFVRISSLPDLPNVWQEGLPYAFCGDLLFAVSQPPFGTGVKDVVVSVISLSSGRLLSQTPVPRGVGQQRIIGGLAVSCGAS